MSKNDSDELFQLYTEAITNYVALLNAKSTIDITEKQLVQNIREFGGDNHYTSANDIPSYMLNQFAKESINVHLGKAQSEQIDETINNQIYQLQKQADKKFLNRKVIVNKTNETSIEACYYDPKTGNVRFSNYKPDSIKGKVKSIVLLENTLFIEPGYLARKLNPNRIMFRVQVLNPNDMNPNIAIKF